MRADPAVNGTPVHLLLACYVLFEPCHGGDLGAVRLLFQAHEHDTEPGNVMIVPPDAEKRCVLLLRDHKTARTYPLIRRVCPQTLSAIIRESLRKHPRDMLFVSPSGVRFSSEAVFTSWANRALAALFGRRVTANTLRHSFISAINPQRTPQAALVLTAERMGHSVAQQRAYHRVSDDSPAVTSDVIESGELLVDLRR